MENAEHRDAGASHLIDVTRFPLDRLVSADDSVLRNSLRRVLADLDRPQEILSAFQSYLSEPAEPAEFSS